MAESKNILTTTSFYDQVAAQYNSNMTVRDSHTRNIVREQFLQLIPKGNVLDFGAGTGMDLTWLIENKSYNIFALEPSTRMRDIAKKSIKQIHEVTFINTNTDFKLWTTEQLPFAEKMDGILANFAVFNHIKQLEVLLEKLSLISNSGCTVVALVLDASFGSLCKNYSFVFAIKNILTSKITVLNKYNESLRETYLHRQAAIRRAAFGHFQLLSFTHIPSTEFTLVILRKP